MKQTFDITKFITENYQDAKAISFADANIKIRKSAQVRFNKPYDAEDYYEIVAGNLSSSGEIMFDDFNIKHEANSGSLKNQILEIGDLLYVMRAKFNKVKIITEDVLSRGLDVVATKGITIIRTGSIDKAKFIKVYLERPEIQKYINDHEKGKLPTDKISIGPKVIRVLLIPDTINEDLSRFVEYSDYLDSVANKSVEISGYIKKIAEIWKSKPCKKGINNASSYDRTIWEALENMYNGVIEVFKEFKKLLP